MTYCTKCGKPNPETAKFCTSCGGLLSASIGSFPKNKNKKWLIIGSITLIGLLTAAWFIFFNNPKKETLVLNDKTTSELKELVNQWNNGLNSGNAEYVSSLYAERLVYYRQQMSKGNAQVLLNDFFQTNPYFSQQITSEISFEKMNDKLIVCNFQKTVMMSGKTTDYPSYLKFSKEDDKWKIVEEGDKITDYNIKKRE